MITKRHLQSFAILILILTCSDVSDAGVVAAVEQSGTAACVRLDVLAATGKVLKDMRTGPASVEAPSKLRLSLEDSPACRANFHEAAAENEVLVVRVTISKNFDSADETDDVFNQAFERGNIASGSAVGITSKHLRTEGTAYIHLQAIVAPKTQIATAIKSINDPAPSDFIVKVLDREVTHAFGYRATVPFIARIHKGATDPEKYSVGVATSLLVYPLRWTWQSSPFLRSLALEGAFGSAKSVIDVTSERNFYIAGIGVSYKGVLGLGLAWDVSESGFYGIYANITLFSENGLFGLVPVSN